MPALPAARRSVDRDEIVRFCNELLDAGAFRDYGPNGLQVVGAPRVTRIRTAVSAGLDVFRRAGADGAELLLVHHGLFWEGAPRVVGSLERRRLEALFGHDVSLVAYHLPLDAHPEIGNNALLLSVLGIQAHEPFAEHGGRPLGRHGVLPEPLSVDEVARRLGEAVAAGAPGSEPRVFGGGPDPVRRVGAVSGGAARDVRQAAAIGLDAFVTGEPEEDSLYLAAELGVTTVALGHNASETLGVQALGARIAERFGVETGFLPVPNPV